MEKYREGHSQMEEMDGIGKIMEKNIPKRRRRRHDYSAFALPVLKDN